jgi:hypothetical protein
MMRDDLRMALDPVVFARRLGFEVPDPWQQQALRWSGSRLLLNCARQSGKSTISALLAAHRAVYFPDSLVLLISPSLRQSAELFRKVSEWLQRFDPPLSLPVDNKLSCTLHNGSRIISLPSSEATIRGFSGVALIIEDEASRVNDSLYFAVRPMLAVSGGRLILMSTPFGRRGHFFQEWTAGGDAWERVEIPAVQNPRISAQFLEAERRSLGEWWYRQEYECQFLDAIDQVFSYDAVMGAMSDFVEPLFQSVDDDLGHHQPPNLIDPSIKSLFGE